MSFQRAEEHGEQLCVGVCHRPDKEHDSVTPREAAGVEGGGGRGGCHLTTASRRGSGRKIQGGTGKLGGK